MSEHQDRRTNRFKIVTVMIAGASVGAFRAITTWLLNHLATHN